MYTVPVNFRRAAARTVNGANMGVMLGYLPVIEHFKLHDCHMKCLPQLRDALLRKFPFLLSVVESLLETIEIHTVMY